MRQIVCVLLSLCVMLTVCALADQEAEAQLQKEIGAFEITAEQRELAKTNEAGYTVLDAGRGNPNWINTQARYAFTRFMEYAISECERTMNEGGMAGQAKADGIGERFDAAMDTDDPTDAFLIAAVDYCVNTLGLDKDGLLIELVDAVIGDYYPSPSRCLPNTEVIMNAFLQATLYDGADLAGQTGVFPTEGGSAAMVYIFEALSHNRLLKPGDTIAIATPIFTPYMQIPSIKDYGLVSVDVESTAEDDWDIAEAQLAKLEDPSVKAFFLVNPSNPASHALSANTLARLSKVVEKNPDLIILTDDVYGTFADEFQTVYAVIPYNTILVYSFSKLYGVTGWRVGLIAMNDDNVCDRLLRELPEADRAYLRDEYSIVTTDPDSLPFLDRVVADSRSIGLYHTSGLSTPSQVFMDLLALTHLLYGEDDPYIRLANDTVRARYDALMDALGLPADDEAQNARYYTVVDVMALCDQRYGEAFSEWFGDSMTEIDFLNDLAAKEGVVLMYGPGFSAPDGTVRISLANLNREDYVEIARRLFELLDAYYAEYESTRMTLEQVVVLSRHNIRSPMSGSGSMLDEITPHEWFEWTSEPSELSLRGAMLETTMGQYFRLWLEDEGLFPKNYRPEEGAVRFYANAKQRTRATAQYFSAGLLPVADVEIEQHADYDTMDPVFTPRLTFLTDEYEADIREQVSALGGVAGMRGISAGLRDNMEMLMDVVDVEDSAAYRSGKFGNLLEDENEILLQIGEEPKLSGPIRTGLSLVDSLVLQYYEEPDEVKAAFGHELTLDDWRFMHAIADTYSDMLFTTPLVSVNLANPLLREIRSEIETEGRKFTFLCGHDSNISSVLGALGVEDYLLPEAIEQRTPIGGKLVIERWLDSEGAAWYDVSLVYQSVDQLRGITPLSLDDPPMKYRLSFKGLETNADGLIAEADFIGLLNSTIGAYDALLERYGAEGDTELAPAA